MKVRQFNKRDMLAATIYVLSTVGVSWSALFCLDRLLLLLGYDHLFHSISQDALLTLTTTLVAVTVRYFPSSVHREQFDAQLRDVAMTTHNNVVASLTHILRGLIVHLTRIRLELDSPDCDKPHMAYLIDRAIEEAELKQGILQTVTDPDKVDSYYRIKL